MALFIITLYAVFISISYLALIIYYIRGWNNLKNYKYSQVSGKTTATIIIPARNEAAYIGELLSDLLKQNYPSGLYEIIVVDDHSEDETPHIVSNINDKRVRLLRLQDLQTEQTKSHKKRAIELAVEKSSGELIITTDADCRMGSKWLNIIVSFYEKEKPVMIAGPVCYRINNDNFFQKFQAIDFLSLVGISASSLGHNQPIFCNGANLAYQRAAFNIVEGFKNIDSLASGDDMLLMKKMNEQFPGKIKFLKSKDAIVKTYPVESIDAFWQQRKRWASKTFHYKDFHVLAPMALAFLLNFSIIVNLFIGLLINKKYLYICLLQFIVKIIIDFIFLKKISHFFGQDKLLRVFLPASIAHVCYTLLMAVTSGKGNYQWKGRITK